MSKKIFIFTENLRDQVETSTFSQNFHGVCCGHKLKKLDLRFPNDKVNLAIGYYIFKIVVNKIDSNILFGDVVSYKFFKE